MIKNLVKEKLNNGETVHGIFASNSDRTQTELLAMLGWDFLVFDGEHGFLEPKELADLSRTCELHKVTPIVRVPGSHTQTVNRYLDAGAHGVIFPMINSGEQAKQIVQTVKYPPVGMRGLAAPRAADFGLNTPLDEYINLANRETLIIAQVETMEALNNLDEILGVKEIDILFLGPTDLSTNMGLCGMLDHPEVKGVISKLARGIVSSGKIFGVYVKNWEDARYYRDERGARFIATGLSLLITKGSIDYLKNLKDEKEKK